MMQWFAIRCCCQPQKVFGFIRLPSESIERGKAVVRMNKPWVTWDALDVQTSPSHTDTTLACVELQIKSIGRMRGDSEWAVYSDDRPIEFWRGVDGFIEAQGKDEP